jgi:hypothetical protein
MVALDYQWEHVDILIRFQNKSTLRQGTGGDRLSLPVPLLNQNYILNALAGVLQKN